MDDMSANRILEMRKYIERTKIKGPECFKYKDFLALGEYIQLDRYDGISLAVLFGQAQGYRAAKAELRKKN